MSRVWLLRLALDGLAAALLMFCFAYWWLGNGAHEAAGAAMFALVAVHVIFNRNWWGGIRRMRREPRNLLNLGLTFALLLAILGLLVTSLLISSTLAHLMPPWGGFTTRQIHAAIAWWLLVIVAAHLGFRWPLLMATARSLLGLREQTWRRTLALRAVAAAVAMAGVLSVQRLSLPDKLTMRMTLDWWSFEEGAAGFFLHGGAVVGLVIVLTYYGLALLRRMTQPGGDRRSSVADAAAGMPGGNSAEGP